MKNPLAESKLWRCVAAWCSGHVPLVVFLFSLVVYLLTMDRSASWWDCGEFIATGYGLQVGHPPGAPFYQLVTHCVMLLSFGNPLLVAPLSNLVSVVCGALTVMLLYLTIRQLLDRLSAADFRSPLPAVVGALCYLFCDTAWFSAVESEVYSMAMLFCSLTVWLMLRWEQRGDHRLLLLTALLLGLGVCVHLMTLLTTPMLLWIFIRRLRVGKIGDVAGLVRTLTACVLFFLLGLTPYAIIPIRAAANPPINEGHPATWTDFKHYVGRDQYDKAPLYPRMWRLRDAPNWEEWGGNDSGLWSNVKYYCSYQLGFMYFRYIMYNFIGRENLKYRIIVISLLPLLLALWGMIAHRRRHWGDFRALLLLFLFGGIILNFYLNHPCYEPRERDYAYVLSFYALAVWMGIGAADLHKRCGKRWMKALLVAAPLTLAIGNWSDHDRHDCHSVHDISLNHLQSCDHGAILLTQGDNDTFPIWYLQYVEQRRPDISTYNINITGYARIYQLLADNNFRRPVYFSQYAYKQCSQYFNGFWRCEGYCWRLLPIPAGANDPAPMQRHIADSICWHITDGEYVNRISRSFLKTWKENTSNQ